MEPKESIPIDPSGNKITRSTSSPDVTPPSSSSPVTSSQAPEVSLPNTSSLVASPPHPPARDSSPPDDLPSAQTDEQLYAPLNILTNLPSHMEVAASPILIVVRQLLNPYVTIDLLPSATPITSSKGILATPPGPGMSSTNAILTATPSIIHPYSLVLDKVVEELNATRNNVGTKSILKPATKMQRSKFSPIENEPMRVHHDEHSSLPPYPRRPNMDTQSRSETSDNSTTSESING